jgi:hypothetical protein
MVSVTPASGHGVMVAAPTTLAGSKKLHGVT